jgi:predicted SnoaL-like aldol condensation-catalyzing enzyme
MCGTHNFQLDYMCATHITQTAIQKAEIVMSGTSPTLLTPEHQDFYERFKSFWAAPSGPRVAEIIAADAKIHFTGQGTMSGTDYINYMTGMLDAFPGMTVKPIDCAGCGEMLYIAWETSSVIHGKPRKFLGVDRFRIIDGLAVEEHIIFDSAVLQLEGRPGIDH